ncbi:site-specific integrase [Aeromicrobium alkaliterrae]|uniref:Tyr recombinase domain-containing protein n=1 Tax=Aeromicrobium alkaliterrae TaxID=302168 RepID=A0ABP4VVI6_9ACTN
MPRHALAPYEVDQIAVSDHPKTPGLVRARARFRREDGGPLLDVYGSGKTPAAAKRDLRANLARKRQQHHGGSDRVSTTSTVEQVAAVWLSEKQAQRPALAEKTLSEYAKWVSAYITGTAYGSLKIGAAANVVRGEQHLRDVANGQHKSTSRGGGEGAMKSARKVLHGITDTAHRHGAIPHPTRFRLQGRTADEGRDKIDTERVFTHDELVEVQAVADAHTADMGDLVAFLTALGPRVSEALHGVTWDDVDLDAGTVTIRGTKSKNAKRTVTMPAWLIERLGARAGLHGTTGLVFGVTRYASKMGQPRDLSNVLDKMRSLLDTAGCPWAGSHTFRRTYATLADDAGASLGQIAAVLGQDPATTATYIKTRPVATAVDVLAR